MYSKTQSPSMSENIAKKTVELTRENLLRDVKGEPFEEDATFREEKVERYVKENYQSIVEGIENLRSMGIALSLVCDMHRRLEDENDA